jgi:hypothetical protein
MADRSWRSIGLKLLIFWILFLIFHFAYDWFPYPAVVVIAGNSEGAVQHIKMAFFAYTFASLIEYGYLRLPKTDRLRFLDSRLIGLLIVSIGTFLWYIVPAIRGAGMPTDLLEIVYANVILLLVGLGTILLERDLVSITLSKASRWVLIIFNLVLMTILVLGTFRTPWGGFWFQ